MSWNNSGCTIDGMYPVFNVWDIQSEREANAKISENLEEMDRLYKECLEIASRYDIRICYTLTSDNLRGHNAWREPQIDWNPSAQHC